MVATVIRSISSSPTKPRHDASSTGRRRLEPRFPAVAAMLIGAEADLPRPLRLPRQPSPQICSTNPLERVNKEIPVLQWSMPDAPRRRLVRWVTVPRPDSKEISGATSFGWLSAA